MFRSIAGRVRNIQFLRAHYSTCLQDKRPHFCYDSLSLSLFPNYSLCASPFYSASSFPFFLVYSVSLSLGTLSLPFYLSTFLLCHIHSAILVGRATLHYNLCIFFLYILDRWFESEHLKATLATDGVIGAMISPRMSGSG